MQNPRSIILAIIPANVDIATQEILEMAAELDVDGERTLRVFTKPDLVDKGAESAVIEKKAFFESERPWLRVSKDRVDITKLRSPLVEVLADMIKREFPRVCIASLHQGPSWKRANARPFLLAQYLLLTRYDR